MNSTHMQSLWLKIGATVQASGVDILMHLTCHLPKVSKRDWNV